MSRYEKVSSVPAFPNVGMTRRKSLAEQVRDMVRSERLAQAAMEGGHESFEEADDFDVGDDYEPGSDYEFEEQFEPEVQEDDRLDRQLVSALRRVLGESSEEASAVSTPEDQSEEKEQPPEK